MMSVYITKNGKLSSNGKTLMFVSEDGEKRKFPIESLRDIFIIGKVSFSSWTIDLCLKKGVPVHFYSVGYIGSLTPQGRSSASGSTIIKQVEAFQDKYRRCDIANEIVRGIQANMKYILRRSFGGASILSLKISFNNIKSLMACEAELWKRFYSVVFRHLDPSVTRRTKKPPKDWLNAAVSYMNSILYGMTLTECQFTSLSPEISYLHEPGSRRPSLVLDIADIFKPVTTFKTLISMVKSKKLSPNDFEIRDGGVFLSKTGKRKVIIEFKSRMTEPMLVPQMRGHYSMRAVIKREFQKLQTAITLNLKYRSFKMR